MSKRTFTLLLIVGVAMIVAGLVLNQARSTPGGAVPPAPTKEPSVRATEPPLPAGAVDCIALERDRIRPRRGFSWSIRLNLAPSAGDDGTNPVRSVWRLYENDRLLGEGHNLHAEIDSKGEGRYSLWRRTLIFSTSDNSDPRTNGRRYELRRLTHETDNEPDLIIGLDQRLPLEGATVTVSFLPFHGATRPAVNPGEPVITSDGQSLRLPRPGEYYFLIDGKPHRVLVLDQDEARHADQIISFVAANTSGGSSGAAPAEQTNAETTPDVDEMIHLLGTTHEPLHLNCEPTTRLALQLLADQGISARPVRWIGSQSDLAGHVGLEFLDRSGRWMYRDPHYGIRFRNDTSALDALLNLLIEEPIADSAFETLVQKADWFGGNLPDFFTSYRACLAHFDPESGWVGYRTTEIEAVLLDARTTTVHKTWSHPDDLEAYRARFYP